VDSQKSRASYGRWSILLMMCLMYLICYLDRVNISTAAISIRQEFGFSQATMGTIFSAFAWGYALFQVPGGWINDRFGPRGVLALLIGYCAIMAALTSLATGLASFVVIRFLLGVGEAGTFPGATRAMQLWFPRGERGFVQGITHSASRLGAAIAPPFVVMIIAAFADWRSVFYIGGLIDIIWVALFFFIYRNMPEQHSWVNKAELAHIRGTDASGRINEAKVEKKPKVPWSTLLRNPNMWAIMLAYFTYVYCLWIFLSWLPSYLVDYRHFTLIKVGLLGSLPLWAGVIGDTVGGLATDWLLKKTGRTNFSRRVVAITGMLGCCVFMIPAGLAENAYVALGCLTAAMFFLECIIGPSWAVPMDVGGKYSGTVSGLMNMAGNIGGALSPLVFGFLVQYGSWQAPFIVAACLLVAGACIWAFWLSPETSVVEPKEVESAKAKALKPA
jgi:sugar phosphate permease